jgi:hypothetical protein
MGLGKEKEAIAKANHAIVQNTYHAHCAYGCRTLFQEPGPHGREDDHYQVG